MRADAVATTVMTLMTAITVSTTAGRDIVVVSVPSDRMRRTRASSGRRVAAITSVASPVLHVASSVNASA